MLSSEERSRIEVEEVFRQEVRRQLEAKMPTPSRGQKLWKVLNSSFSVWFLSSVVIASLTWAVATYERSRSEQAQRTEHQKRLNTEIGFRIENGINGLLADEERMQLGIKLSRFWIYNDGLNYLNNRVIASYTARPYPPPEQVDYSVYPEYRDRKFRSLLYELRSVAHTSTAVALRDADIQYKNLEDITSTAQVVEERPQTTSNVATIEDAEKVLQILRRLQANAFWRAGE